MFWLNIFFFYPSKASKASKGSSYSEMYLSPEFTCSGFNSYIFVIRQGVLNIYHNSPRGFRILSVRNNESYHCIIKSFLPQFNGTEMSLLFFSSNFKIKNANINNYSLLYTQISHLGQVCSHHTRKIAHYGRKSKRGRKK